MNNIYIFDLDYTLLDTRNFISSLVDALEINLEEFHQFTQKLAAKKMHYNHLVHLDFIHQDGGQKAAARSRIEEVFKGIDSFIHPDIFVFLRELKEQGHELILCTLGDEEYQRSKVESSNLNNLMDEVIYVDSNKIMIIKKFIVKGKRIVVFNDNAQEILQMKEFYPELKYYLIKGPYSDNNENIEPMTILNGFKLELLSAKNKSI